MNDKKYDTNEIAAFFLGIMGILAIISWAVCSFKYGQIGGTEIAISISSGLGGVITGKALGEHDALKKIQKGENENEP